LLSGSVPRLTERTWNAERINRYRLKEEVTDKPARRKTASRVRFDVRAASTKYVPFS
ncbi:unnamed protein product, partial [Tenebrio molitor]